METMELEEAAKFLHMNPEVLRRKAKSGIIPGRKCGKRWVFVKESLATWISQPQITELNKKPIIIDNSLMENKKCHSIDEKRFGISNLQRPTAAEYKSRLERQSKRTH